MAKQIPRHLSGANADSPVASRLTGEWITATAAGTSSPVLLDSFLSISDRGFNVLLDPLTVRQREILVAYLLTRCDKTVARKFRVKETTVRNQLTAIEAKLNVESRPDLVSKCWAGLVHEFLAVVERRSRNSCQL